MMLSAVRFVCETGAMVCVPVRYVPDEMVCCVVDALYVVAPFVVTDAVSDTDVLPAVPLEMYPADTCGVLDTVFDSISVFVPVLTVADEPLMDDAGVAVPLATDAVA